MNNRNSNSKTNKGNSEKKKELSISANKSIIKEHVRLHYL